MRTTRSLAAILVVLAGLLAVAAGLARGSAEVRAPLAPLPGEAQPLDEAAARELYLQSCASCHGRVGGGSEIAPSLLDVGAASVHFQLTTGRMPFAGQPGEQARRKPVAFSEAQIDALVDYVVRFGDGVSGPQIPSVRLDAALLQRGHELFVGNCAPCHGSTGNGGAGGGGALAPPLDQATSVQVAEAMLVGPGQMPIFAYPQRDLDAVATYVDYLQTAPDPGGFSIGGIGPVPEGFVAWVLGTGLLVVLVYLIGREWGDRGGSRTPTRDADE